MNAARSVSAVALLLVAAGTASGQCERQWLTGDGVRGVFGSPNVATTWDPDGAGPQQEVLVLAGSILQGGTSPAWIVSTWDGAAFRPLANTGAATSSRCEPGSLCTVSAINAVTVFQGDLVVAGQFNVGDSSNATLNVARWTGSAWEAVGTGLEPDVNRGLPFRVLSLGVWQNSLVAACSDRSYILTNGTWTRFGANRVDDVRDYITFNGEFFRAGALPGSFVGQEAVERWNGSAWEGVWGNLLNGFGYDLFVFNNELHVVARTSFGGPSILFSGVFKWLGGSDWQQVGPLFQGIATKAAVYNNEIYVLGQLAGDQTGTVGTNVLRFDAVTQTWQGIGPINASTQSPGIAGNLRDFAVYDGKLFVVGEFNVAGNTPTANVIAWDGNAWSAPAATGSTGPVGGVAVADGKTYVAGNFGAIGNATALNVAVDDGSGWQQAGGGFARSIGDLSSFGNTVALVTSNGLAAEVFALQSGVWTQLGSALPNPTGFIPIGFVDELDGQLYASTLTSSTPLYRWDGFDWQVAMNAPTIFASVYDTTRFQGQLVVGGNSLVETFGGVFASCVGTVDSEGNVTILGRDDGDSPLLTGIVQAVEVYNGELYAAGSELRLPQVGSGFIGNIAKWTGSDWVPVASGVQGALGPGFIRDMKVLDGELIVSGFFNTAGGAPARNIAAWNGTSWRALDGGLGQPTNGVSPILEAAATMAVDGDELVVVGSFLTAGSQSSAFVARWACAAGCDSIDFNRNTVFPEDQDVIDFFNVLAGGPCPYAEPCDIDINNNTVFPEDQDVIDFFAILAGGECSR
ncbi:MAG TPA: hypothetical protein VK157_17095 [Phycisphaerales bacterium]|nr:hypothetical protein [Phycisphaerales bacterium]